MGWNPFKSAAKKISKGVKNWSNSALGKVTNTIFPQVGIVSDFFGGSSLFGNSPDVQAQYDVNDANLALQREMNQQNQNNWQAQMDWTKQEAARNQANWQSEQNRAQSNWQSEQNRSQQNWQSEFDFTKQQFQYQQEQNALTQAREDNAIQRRVADAVSAGLSPLSVAGSSPANSSVVSAGNGFSGAAGSVGSSSVGSGSSVGSPGAPEMRAPYLQAPSFQNDLQIQSALLNFASQALLQDRDLSSKEKVAQMQTSTQKFIAVAQLENAKSIADASNDNQLKIATNQLIELNRSNTAKEYQAKLDYFKDYVQKITDGHGQFETGHSTVECREHNEAIAQRWADFVKTLPMDSASSASSESSSLNGGLNVKVIGGNLGKSSSTGEQSGYSQNNKVRAEIKSFWLRRENWLWLN